jgi:putative ABC transport system permease protein
MKATRYRTGHVQIHAAGYDAIARKLPLNLAIARPAEVIRIVEADPRVTIAAERIRFFSYISHGEQSLHTVAIAFDPDRERAVALLPECVRTGRYPSSRDPAVLITERLARMLGVTAGDTLKLKARTVHDVPNIVQAEVAGIIRPPFNSLDQTLFFVPIALARELLTLESAATEIVVMARDVGDAQALARELPLRFGPERAGSLEVFDWKHYETALVADIYIDTRFLAFFFGILLLISIFIMNNSMSMTVFERMREFGTMRALGMSKDGLLALVSTESALIGALGSIAGCLLGGALCWYFGIYGIPTDVGELSSIPVSPRFYAMSRPAEYIACLVLGVFLGFFGGMRAAFRARGTNIVRILQSA